MTVWHGAQSLFGAHAGNIPVCRPRLRETRVSQARQDLATDLATAIPKGTALMGFAYSCHHPWSDESLRPLHGPGEQFLSQRRRIQHLYI